VRWPLTDGRRPLSFPLPLAGWTPAIAGVRELTDGRVTPRDSFRRPAPALRPPPRPVKTAGPPSIKTSGDPLRLINTRPVVGDPLVNVTAACMTIPPAIPPPVPRGQGGPPGDRQGLERFGRDDPTGGSPRFPLAMNVLSSRRLRSYATPCHAQGAAF
jgi:hypothetical protein